MSLVVPTTVRGVTVTANPAGLAAGNYYGTVTISEPGRPSIAVPVTLAVWSNPPPLTITQGSFTFVQTVGKPVPPYQTAEVDSGGVPLPLTFLNGTSWLNVVDHYEVPTPAPIQVGIVNGPGSPGEIRWLVHCSSAGQLHLRSCDLSGRAMAQSLLQ